MLGHLSILLIEINIYWECIILINFAIKTLFTWFQILFIVFLFSYLMCLWLTFCLQISSFCKVLCSCSANNFIIIYYCCFLCFTITQNNKFPIKESIFKSLFKIICFISFRISSLLSTFTLLLLNTFLPFHYINIYPLHTL